MSRHPHDDRAGPPSAAFRFLYEHAAPGLHWLWPQRLPLGCLSLLIGDPAAGKSLLTVDLAARLSVPHPWPDHPPAEFPAPATPPGLQFFSLNSELRTRDADPVPTSPTPHLPTATVRGFPTRYIAPTGVLFAAPEDHAALHDRLTAAGADLLRISVLDGVYPPYSQDILPFRLPDHADQLEHAICAHDHPRLVVLDPFHALLADGVFSSPDRHAALLARLTAIARYRGVAILAVAHFSKTPNRREFYRIRGSVSLVAAARSILWLTTAPDCPARRILTQVKNTHGPLAPPLAFRIVVGPASSPSPSTPPQTPGINPAPHLEWDDPAQPDWRLATGTLDLSPETASALSETCAWLTDFLSAGPRPAREVLASAHTAGIPRVTLFRAKRLLNIPSRRVGTAWTWLPPPV